MERLTIRNSDCTVSQPTHTTFEKAINRLAEYEDTGLTPEEIIEMKLNLLDMKAMLSFKPNPTQEYAVEITETSQTTVYVEAHNRGEALCIAKKGWENGNYILDEKHFKGVVFDVL